VTLHSFKKRGAGFIVNDHLKKWAGSAAAAGAILGLTVPPKALFETPSAFAVWLIAMLGFGIWHARNQKKNEHMEGYRNEGYAVETAVGTVLAMRWTAVSNCSLTVLSDRSGDAKFFRHEHTTTIPGRSDETGQHARQRRAVARGVALSLPPTRSHAERRSWRDHIPGADVRSILVAQQGGGAYSSSPNTLPVDWLIRWNRVQARHVTVS
jgi:hypothetical protein